jgi:signal transduction histidine kinase
MPLSTKPLASWAVNGRRWVILAMLLSLHAGLLSDSGSDFQRIWLIVHFGLFLLWQPFISTDRELKVFAVVLLLGITAVVLISLAGWMLVAWIALLIGIMGGKVFTLQAARRSRFYLVAVFYLFTVLLVWTVPVSLLNIENIPPGLRALVTIFLPVSLLAMLVLPYRPEDEGSTQVFDFFYSIIVFQLVVVLVLGSIAAMRVSNNQYFQAVLITVLAFGIALFILAILWGPKSGFGGLRTYFSRYLMSVGMPFELWMRRIAELSEGEMSSARFLENALEEIEKFPWIVGCKWQSPDGRGDFGKETEFSSQFYNQSLDITFYTEISLSPALFLHLRLLAQVIGEFYEGKRREQVLKQNAYMQAVYETGARLTHDMKNLLQSLYALTSSGEIARENDRRAQSQYQALLHRQLPLLAKRLQSTLDKLQNPELGAISAQIAAADWWRDVQNRHADEGISLQSRGPLASTVPVALFDSVLENCLENSRKKKQSEPGIHIIVEFADEDSPILSVIDTGSAIPGGAVEALFRAPFASSRRGGYGIGLYQAARQATQAGFELRLAENEVGKVRFELRRDTP